MLQKHYYELVQLNFGVKNSLKHYFFSFFTLLLVPKVSVELLSPSFLESVYESHVVMAKVQEFSYSLIKIVDKLNFITVKRKFIHIVFSS